MNCPSGGPSDLRESTTAEAHSSEEALSVTSTRLQPGVSPILLPSRLHDIITLNERFIDMLSALNRILQLLSIRLVKKREIFILCESPFTYK